jgi:hypothetical protein
MITETASSLATAKMPAKPRKYHGRINDAVVMTVMAIHMGFEDGSF